MHRVIRQVRSNSTSTTFWADDTLSSILDSFKAPVRFAAGYGSGVFKQASYEENAKAGTKKGPMIDLIFGVTHPEHWHSLNVRQNPHHYSFIQSFGSQTISVLQEKFGAGVYFNPDVTVRSNRGDIRVKYGVVSMDRLIADLKDWETLYLAGRMQKPTKILRGDSRVKLANDANLENAVRIALLSLPTEFTEEDFFKALVSISYLGDFRMMIAENPRKVHNIVVGQIAELRAMYRPIVENCPNVLMSASKFWKESPDTGLDSPMKQDDDARLRAALLLSLPKKMRDKIIDSFRLSIGNIQVSNAFAQSPEVTQLTQSAIRSIVRAPAFTQSVKGLLTAGPSRSLKYIGEKITKRFA
ncbi:Mitochondrial translocator assembly and maintenance protein 41 [Dinochytrium kinnereticum]|nr:Mitochondrial translocator assembly and maintenance protein 41 [Dinochytrium kinnereticum]